MERCGVALDSAHFMPSTGMSFATSPRVMNREQAFWIANYVASTLARPCYPVERSADELARVLHEIMESQRRGELSDEDAKTVISTIIAADVEQRISVILSGLFQNWANASTGMYTWSSARRHAPSREYAYFV